MKTRMIKPATGKILISQPFLNEVYFQRSVVLLAEHSAEGSFGLVMNKPLNIHLNEVLSDFPEFTAGIFIGGPVKTDSLFFIHTMGKEIPKSIKILDGLWWGGDIELIRELITNKKIATEQIRFYLGYSGWGPNQLESELLENSWVVSSSKVDILLKTPSQNLWNKMVRTLGPEYTEWINSPADPSLN